MPVNRRVNSLCAQKIVLPFIDMHWSRSSRAYLKLFGFVVLHFFTTVVKLAPSFVFLFKGLRTEPQEAARIISDLFGTDSASLTNYSWGFDGDAV